MYFFCRYVEKNQYCSVVPQKRLHASKSESDRRHFQQKADILDRQIDALVYELYGLTEAEIKIVEGVG